MNDTINNSKTVSALEKSGKKLGSFKLFFPSAIAVLLLLAIYASKGIFPFGGETIVFGDFPQTTLPAYFHLHDAVYAGKGFFWDFNSSLGVNAYAFSAFSGVLSPLTLLVLLVPRDFIVEFVSLLLIVKVALLALAANLFFRKAFSALSFFWQTILSLLYAFSGYVLMYYSLFQFIDAAILFPVLLLSLIRLYKKDQLWPYIFCLSLSTVMCYYTSFMIILFIFFSSGLIIKFYIPKERRGKVILNLSLSTGASLLISSFVIVPAYLQISNSVRLSLFNLETLVNSGIGQLFANKAAVFYTLGIVPALLVYVIFLYFTKKLTKEDKKFFVFSELLIFSVTAGVLVESINLIWHTGSYVMFPLRYGFIPVFVILAVCGYWLNSHDFIGKVKMVRSNVLHYILLGVFTAGGLIALYHAVSTADQNKAAINSAYTIFTLKGKTAVILWSVFLLFALTYLFILKFGRYKTAVKTIISVVVIAEILTYSGLYIGIKDEKLFEEQSARYIYESEGLRDNAAFSKGRLDRVKDRDMNYNSNYPFILGRPSLSGWVHFITEQHQDTIKKLGYSVTYTRTLDPGGTLFSDALLNIKDIITEDQLEPSLYEKIISYKGLNVYKAKQTLPFGFVVPPDRGVLASNNINLSPFEFQNQIYRSLSGKNEDIVNILNPQPILLNLNKVTSGDFDFYIKTDESPEFNRSLLQYNIEITKPQMLYLSLYECYRTVTVSVNGRFLNPANLNIKTSSTFPGVWDNGIIELGYFEEGNVTVTLDCSEDGFIVRNLQIGSIETNTFSSFIKEYENKGYDYEVKRSTLKMHVKEGSKGEMLFIPVSYDKGFSCTVNGKKQEIQCVAGNFIGVDLTDGENTVVLRFAPKWFSLSLLISILTAGILLLFKLTRISKILENKGVILTTKIVYWSVFLTAVLALYAAPAAIFVYKLIAG